MVAVLIQQIMAIASVKSCVLTAKAGKFTITSDLMGNSGMIAGAFSSVSGKADKTLDTNGQILYYNSGRQALNIGTEGKVLTVSSSDLPAWETASAGAWSQIASSNLSGGVASSLTVTGMTKKKFLDINIAGGFASADIPAIQIGDGSINTSNYAWNVTQNGAASTTGTGSEIQCTNATTGSNFYIHAYLFNNSVDLNSFVGQTTSNNVSWTWTAYWNNSSQIDQLKLFGSDGGNNLSTPTQIVIYGAD